ncbi:hypothetical protein PG988_001987 [Apiospora saccharicola]
MSFGFSVSDFAILIKGLNTVTRLIKGDAAHEFQDLARLFKQYASFARKLQGCHNRGYLSDFAVRSMSGMDSTLRQFFRRFKELDPYLGEKGRKSWFLKALSAIKWPKHRHFLKDLQRSFERQLVLLNAEFALLSG